VHNHLEKRTRRRVSRLQTYPAAAARHGGSKGGQVQPPFFLLRIVTIEAPVFQNGPDVILVGHFVLRAGNTGGERAECK